MQGLPRWHSGKDQTVNEGRRRRLGFSTWLRKIPWSRKQQTTLVFPGGSGVKNLPAKQEMQETRARFLVREDPLEEAMATHSSILA